MRCNINYIVDGYVIIFNYFPFLLKLLKHWFWRLGEDMNTNTAMDSLESQELQHCD